MLSPWPSAKLSTDESQIVVNGSVRNMNAPIIDARLHASLSLPEIERSADIRINANAKGAPKTLAAEFAAHMDTNAIEIQTARLTLGQSSFQASGALRSPSHANGVQFNATLALGELSRLMTSTSTAASGAILVNGNAQLDAHNNYAVDGSLNTRDLAVRSGTTRISNVSLYSPFHADPYLISLDGLKLNALGGDLTAKVFIENLQRLSVEGNLRRFSLPVLAAAFTGKHLGYDGIIDGSIKAQGDLKANGAEGYAAEARLAIVPGNRGVPVSGRVNASYAGNSGIAGLDHSYLAMPHSRIDVSGSLNRRIEVNVISHNLNDFLPAANFASSKPQTSLPVTLQGGTANVSAQIAGNLSAPRITSHIAMDRFAVEQRVFDGVSADIAASPSSAAIQNGVLTRRTLRTTFDASIGLRKWSPTPRSQLTANIAMRNGDIADLLALAGEGTVPATGTLGADVHIGGTYGNPLGSASLEVTNGSAYQQPIDRLTANVSLSDQLVTLSRLELASGAAQVGLSGTFHHPRDSLMVGRAQIHVASSNVQLANIKPLQRENAGVAGLIRLTADAAADITRSQNESQIMVSNIDADLSARGLRVQNQDAGDLTASAHTAGGSVNYNLSSDFAGSNIGISGNTVLEKTYPTTATASIRNLSVEKTLLIAGQSSIPARGTLSADAHVAGTLAAPRADLSFALVRANLYQEPIDRLAGTLRYSNTLVEIPSLQVRAPAGSITLAGSLTHPASNFNAGSLDLKVTSTDMQLGKIEHAQQAEPGIAGHAPFGRRSVRQCTGAQRQPHSFDLESECRRLR